MLLYPPPDCFVSPPNLPTPLCLTVHFGITPYLNPLPGCCSQIGFALDLWGIARRTGALVANHEEVTWSSRTRPINPRFGIAAFKRYAELALRNTRASLLTVRQGDGALRSRCLGDTR